MLKWKHVYGGFTPGGDPAWSCPNCGYEHVYGIESFNGPYYVCPQCREDIIYPHEVYPSNQQVAIEFRFNPATSEKMLADYSKYRNSKCSNNCTVCSLFSGDRRCMAPYLKIIDTTIEEQKEKDV